MVPRGVVRAALRRRDSSPMTATFTRLLLAPLQFVRQLYVAVANLRVSDQHERRNENGCLHAGQGAAPGDRARASFPRRESRRKDMMDIVFIGVIVAFFALSAGLV